MDMETGKIYFSTEEELEELEKKLGRKLVPLKGSEAKEFEHLSKQARKNKMRNQPCPCGSGKKFKKCCLHFFTGSRKPYKKGLTEIFKGGNK